VLFDDLVPELNVSWGPAPKPPWFRFAEGLASHSLLRSRTTLFASFSGKRRALSEVIGAYLGEKSQLTRYMFFRQIRVGGAAAYPVRGKLLVYAYSPSIFPVESRCNPGRRSC
jgi:hypothetical protein